MHTLERIRVRNFRSIADQTIDLRRLNLFIGGNGSGKSNFIAVFQLLNRIVARELQTYTGSMGGADKILHFGRKHSDSLEINVTFAKGQHANGYGAVLIPTADDRFVFEDESFTYHDRVRYPAKPYDDSLGSGHSESRLVTQAMALKEPSIVHHVAEDLAQYRIYHFHDTSAGSRVKQTGDINDNRQLQADAGNLAAFLYALQQRSPNHFRNIEDTIRQVAPFFAGFDLAPSPLNIERIRLQWREKGADSLFGPEALSDGTLRFICLTTLFFQPTPPPVILIDEPELGLHPAAIVFLAGMLRSVSTNVQIILATQSVPLVNQFTPEDLCVVERQDGASVFRRFGSDDLASWLDDYALGDLWEKNLLGGRP